MILSGIYKQWNVYDIELNITRMEPGNGCVTLEWQYSNSNVIPSDFQYQITYNIKGCDWDENIIAVENNINSITVEGLENNLDYEISVLAVRPLKNNACIAKEIIEKSRVRLVRPGIVPGKVINYIHPDDFTYAFSGRSTASPSIAKLPDGRLVVSHDIFWGESGQNLSKIFLSYDDGETWKYMTDLYPCFWGKLFVHNEKLYMLSTSTEYGDLLIGRSDDGGRTWTPPTIIIEGGSRQKGGPHKAPMPVIMNNGRIWTAIDYGSWFLGGHASGVISALADSDLLSKDSWTVTPFLPYDSSWPGTVTGGKPSLLEGNVVASPDNRLYNLLRYNTAKGNPDYGKAIILNINKNNPEDSLTFGKVIDFHGNMSKFTVYYDPISQRYWSLVNKVTTSNVAQRNILSLVSSEDLYKWEVIQDILNYEENGWLEGNDKVGFQYADWIFDGEDILAVSRTAINGAHNFHDANHITFHRIKNFRKIKK